MPDLKLDAARGRLYVFGPGARRVARVSGAYWNERRQAMELSLTLETLRRVGAALGWTDEQLRFAATPTLARWYQSAVVIEQRVAALHTRLAEGYRTALPWADVEEQLPPFAHQQVMATAAVEMDGVALLCDVGTGKTRAGAEAALEMMRRGVVEVLVVVSPRGVMSTWDSQLARWAPGMSRVRLEGTLPRREAVLHGVRAGTHRLAILTNYEALAKLSPALLALAGRCRVGVIFDEMHRAKNPQAQMTKAALAFAPHCRWRVGMTATPLANGLGDVWSQWYLCDLGVTFGGNFTQYRREYFSHSLYTHEWTVTREGKAEIAARMQRRAVRYTQDECLDLPPKSYVEYEVEMSREQARIYRDMSQELLASLGEDTEAAAFTAAMRLQRLSQICSGWVTATDGTVQLVPGSNPKIEAVKELVREHIGAHQIVVWAFYRQDHDLLMEALAEFRPALIRGGVAFDERERIERAFARGEIRLLVGAPAAAGVGLNLQAADLAIYYSNWYSLIDREQSEGRTRRAGSERHAHITYIDLVMKDSLDRTVLTALKRKKSLLEFVRDARARLVT